MRILFILLLLLFLAIWIIPYSFGIKAEGSYHNIVDQWSRAGRVNIISTRYSRGWLRSEAETEYEIQRGGKMLLNIKQRDSIIHGPVNLRGLLKGNLNFEPFLAVINSELVAQPHGSHEFYDLSEHIPPLEISTNISFNGNAFSRLSMSPISYKVEGEKESISSQGLSGSASFKPNLNKIKMHMNAPGINVVDRRLSLSMKDIELIMNLSGESNTFRFPLGEFIFTTEIFELNRTGPKDEKVDTLIVNGFKLSGSSSLKGGSLSGSQTMGFEELNINDSAYYGPGICELSVRNLDAQALHNIEESINDIHGDVTENNQQIQAILSRIIKHLPDLLEKSPEFEITRLSLDTPEGKLLGNAKIAIDGSNTDMLVNPLFIFSLISAEAKISVPMKLFEAIILEFEKEKLIKGFEKSSSHILDKIELNVLAKSAAGEKIQNLQSNNIFVFKDDRYELNAKFKNGQFKLNGHLIPIPLLLR